MTSCSRIILYISVVSVKTAIPPKILGHGDYSIVGHSLNNILTEPSVKRLRLLV